jgi:hypothetical protein
MWSDKRNNCGGLVAIATAGAWRDCGGGGVSVFMRSECTSGSRGGDGEEGAVFTGRQYSVHSYNIAPDVRFRGTDNVSGGWRADR